MEILLQRAILGAYCCLIGISVFVYPDIEHSIEIDISDADIRIDTFRSNGAGGQHVNTTDSAIRMTHIPTGIVAVCQSDRSRHKNRAQYMKIPKARLYDHELKEKQKESGELDKLMEAFLLKNK